MKIARHRGMKKAINRAYAAFVAQGLGDADRQAPRHEEGDRGPSTSLAVIMPRIWVDGGWLSIDQGGLRSPGIPGIEAYRPLD
jgi:hypothetical protein